MNLNINRSNIITFCTVYNNLLIIVWSIFLKEICLYQLDINLRSIVALASDLKEITKLNSIIFNQKDTTILFNKKTNIKK